MIDWFPSRRAAIRFRQELERYLGHFLPDWLQSGHLMSSHDGPLAGIAERMARRMITGIAFKNARSWRAAAAQSTQGRRIYEALRAEREGPLAGRIEQLIQENARLIRSLPLSLALRTDRYISEKQNEGLRSDEIVKEVRRRLPQLAKSRCRLIARTETAKAETAVTRARAEALNLDWYLWSSSEDERVRDSHANLDGVLVSWHDAPAPEHLIHVKSTLGHYHAGNSPNCFPGDTQVESISGIKKLWRAFYSGDMITIRVANGVSFRVTPNHPILTRRGWVAAGALDESDDLIQACRNGRIITNVNSAQSPSTFEEMFTAGTGHPNTTIGGLSFNFHGDVFDRNVDEVTITDSLPLDAMSSSFETISNFALAGPNGMIGFVVFRASNQIACPDSPSSADQMFSFIRSSGGHSDKVGSRSVANRNTVLLEDAENWETRHVEVGGDSYSAPLFGSVKRNDFLFRNIMPSVGGSPSAARNDYASGPEFNTEWIGTDADMLGGFPQRPALAYKFSRVIDKSVRRFSGHVYTLESNNGWYSVTSAHIIAKNCRCVSIPLVNLDQVSWPHRVYAQNAINKLTRVKFRALNQSSLIAA